MSFFCLVSNAAFYPTGVTYLSLMKIHAQGQECARKINPRKVITAYTAEQCQSFLIPISKNYEKTSFYNHGAFLWNNLNPIVVEAASLRLFKKLYFQ